jgi:hypothetical protein
MYKKVTKVKEYFTNKEGEEVQIKTVGEKSEAVVIMDVPLSIRILEHVREKVTNDVEVHKLAKVLTDLSEEHTVLRMSDYEKVLAESMKP